MRQIALLVVVALGFSLAVQTAGAQTNCAPGSGPSSRTCLITIADQYFAALVAHDREKAPITVNARVSVNGVPPSNAGSLTTNAAVTAANALTSSTLTESLWKTVSEGPTTFKIYVPDPVSQNIGGIAMIKVEGKPTEIAFHLKLDNGRITEADHVLVPITNAAALANLTTPRPAMLAAVPAANRISRENLRLFAYTYYDTREQGAHALPLADNCVRRENGISAARPASTSAPSGRGGRVVPINAVTTPTPECGAPLTTPQVSYIDSINLNRVRLADPETGLVFTLTFNFISNVGGEFTPFPFAAAHINKVQDNKIRDIEAVGFGTGTQGAPTPSIPAPLKSWIDFTR